MVNLAEFLGCLTEHWDEMGRSHDQWDRFNAWDRFRANPYDPEFKWFSAKCLELRAESVAYRFDREEA